MRPLRDPVSAKRQQAPGRQIGAIFVEKRLITTDQLARALAEQERTGRLLGEICVASYGLDRMSLADVLTEQWDELQEATPAHGVFSAEEAFQVLLREADATRAELKLKTGQINKRLAALEALVGEVNDALAELRVPAADREPESAGQRRGRKTTTSAATRPKRAPTSARSATSRPTSA